MSQYPKDDRELISFLQQYRPLPPPAGSTLEKQIYRKISSEPQQSKNHSIRWLVPGMIAASLLGIWGIYNGIKPSAYQQFVEESQIIQKAEIENFMINTWEETINTSSWDNTDQSVYYQWISFDNVQNHYLVSNP